MVFMEVIVKHIPNAMVPPSPNWIEFEFISAFLKYIKGDSVLENLDIFMLFSILQSKQYEMKRCFRVFL